MFIYSGTIDLMFPIAALITIATFFKIPVSTSLKSDCPSYNSKALFHSGPSPWKIILLLPIYFLENF
jgi:hypothetical protein